MSDLRAAFVEAFNARDLDAMASLLAADATAQVLGAPFPEERGVEMVRQTSLSHICDPAVGLVASLATIDGETWILLRTAGGSGPIDTALTAAVDGDAITRVEYVVAPHRPRQLQLLGVRCGLPTLADG